MPWIDASCELLLPIGHVRTPPPVNHYETNVVAEQLIIGSDMPATAGRKER
ncbi:hypothetical protein [Candidatus Poriferisodalis sp.]|uniref:hypothetical protein n=1 Tax=Candidatus Poriferisodalis sp. TaxID=3101277 RepID=UPI003B52FEEC